MIVILDLHDDTFDYYNDDNDNYSYNNDDDLIIHN
jgi:hypothetical protein